MNMLNFCCCFKSQIHSLDNEIDFEKNKIITDHEKIALSPEINLNKTIIQKENSKLKEEDLSLLGFYYYGQLIKPVKKSFGELEPFEIDFPKNVEIKIEKEVEEKLKELVDNVVELFTNKEDEFIDINESSLHDLSNDSGIDINEPNEALEKIAKRLNRNYGNDLEPPKASSSLFMTKNENYYTEIYFSKNFETKIEKKVEETFKKLADSVGESSTNKEEKNPSDEVNDMNESSLHDLSNDSGININEPSETLEIIAKRLNRNYVNVLEPPKASSSLFSSENERYYIDIKESTIESYHTEESNSTSLVNSNLIEPFLEKEKFEDNALNKQESNKKIEDSDCSKESVALNEKGESILDDKKEDPDSSKGENDIIEKDKSVIRIALDPENLKSNINTSKDPESNSIQKPNKRVSLVKSLISQFENNIQKEVGLKQCGLKLTNLTE